MKEKVDKYLRESPKYLCMTTDGWSDIFKEPVVIYMVSDCASTIFLESKHTQTQAHTGQFICADIIRVMKTLSKPVIGAVTDVTSAHQLAWKLLEEKFPGRFFYGCFCHTLQLLVKDLFEDIPSAPSTSQSVFGALAAFVKECKTLCVHIRNTQGLNSRYQELRNIHGGLRLQLPCVTRWGRHLKMLQVLKGARVAICKLVEDDVWYPNGTGKSLKAETKELRRRLKTFVLSMDYEKMLNKGIFILSLIQEKIAFFECDHQPLSDVVYAFKHLIYLFETQNEDALHEFRGCLTQNELTELRNKIEARSTFVIKKAHRIAFLLDPRYYQFSEYNMLRASMIQDLVQYGASCNLDIVNNDFQSLSDQETPQIDEPSYADRATSIRRQYSSFVSIITNAKVTNQHWYETITMMSAHPRTTWRAWFSDMSDLDILKDIAEKVFTLIASTASSERGFSSMALTHNKTRNGLLPHKVKKMTFIRMNEHALFKPSFPGGLSKVLNSQGKIVTSREELEAEATYSTSDEVLNYEVLTHAAHSLDC